MKTFEVVIHHYHPSLAGSHQYLSNTFEAADETSAKRQALTAYKKMLPFLIRGEVIKVVSVRELTADNLRFVNKGEKFRASVNK